MSLNRHDGVVGFYEATLRTKEDDVWEGAA